MLQKGYCSLVCSADLSIGCLLTKLKELKETAEEAECEEESESEVTPDEKKSFFNFTVKKFIIIIKGAG